MEQAWDIVFPFLRGRGRVRYTQTRAFGLRCASRETRSPGAGSASHREYVLGRRTPSLLGAKDCRGGLGLLAPSCRRHEAGGEVSALSAVAAAARSRGVLCLPQNPGCSAKPGPAGLSPSLPSPPPGPQPSTPDPGPRLRPRPWIPGSDLCPDLNLLPQSSLPPQLRTLPVTPNLARDTNPRPLTLTLACDPDRWPLPGPSILTLRP